MVKAKGVFDLLEAYGRLAPELRSEVGLVFAGDGPERAEWRPWHGIFIRGRCILRDLSIATNWRRYYGLAECFVLPTHSDPWGLVVNEAMACGLPVICTRGGGVRGRLGREATADWLRRGNVEQLAETMTADRRLTRELRRCDGREHSAELIRNYSPELCAAGIARGNGRGGGAGKCLTVGSKRC